MNKKYLPFILAALSMLLIPMITFADDYTNITANVPSEHMVTVSCSDGGSFYVSGTEYFHSAEFTVKRFDRFTATAAPDEDYYIAAMTCNEPLSEIKTEQSISVPSVNADTVIRIEFAKKNDKPSVFTSDDCVICSGDDGELNADVKSQAEMTYLWEISSDDGITWKKAPGNNNSRKYLIKNAQLNESHPEQYYIYRFTATPKEGNAISDVVRVLVSDDYPYRTVDYSDKDNDISVTAFMHEDTQLEVNHIDHISKSAVKLTSEFSDDSLPLMLCGISLINNSYVSKPYFGKLKIRFNVGELYNDKIIRVFHLTENEIISHEGTVKDGILTIEANSLSIFAVEVPESSVFKIVSSASSGGDIFPSGVRYVGKQSTLTFMLAPDWRHIIDKCYVNGEAVDIKDNTYTIKNVNGDVFVTVSFKTYWEYWVWHICFFVGLALAFALIWIIRRLRRKKKQQE